MSPRSFYLDRDSGLHRLHPLTKLVIAGALIGAAFAVEWMFISTALFVLVVLPLALWGRIAPELLRTTLGVVLPLALSLFLVQGLFFPGAEQVVWSFGPIAFKAEGLAFAFGTATRLFVIAGASLLVFFTTQPADLALALVQIGAPSSLAYVAVTAIQILPEMQARAESIHNAQAARGLETTGSILLRARAFIPLIAPLVYSALEGVHERALALEARAFGRSGPKTSWRTLYDSTLQKSIRWLLVALTLFLFAAAFVF